ncbi:MAG: hypothetical protein NTY37_13495 [Methanothrix sp.]|nr:hypothetical protein [Methanothrix sp.]
MMNMGYSIDSRDTLNFWAELSDWTSLLSNIIITPMLGANSLGSYNLYVSKSLDSQSVRDQISLSKADELRKAGENPGIFLIVDCNGRDWGDDINIKEMKIVRE